MREGIHPDYPQASIVCACGSEYTTRSTRGDFHVEVCAACHPFFTGQQKLIDTQGRIEKFRNRYSKTPAAPAADKKAEPKKAEKADKAAKA